MIRFKLNMQILCDTLLEHYQSVTFYSASDTPCLEDIRLYQPDTVLNPKYVYLIQTAALPSVFQPLPDIRYIWLGKPQPEFVLSSSPVLIIEDPVSYISVFTLLQNTFELYHEWDQKLNLALNSQDPLNNMLTASLPIFRNPLFVHDPNYYVLSCPRFISGMMNWEQDPRTGFPMVPLARIHDFRLEVEYLKTLNTKTPSIYSAGQGGYQILYLNLWNEDHYEGRICIDELETSLQPGQKLALTHLGSLITSSIKSHNLFRLSMSSDPKHFLLDYINGTIHEQPKIMKFLYIMNWKRYDSYLCLRLETEQQDIQMLSSAATLTHIETQIRDGYAFFYNNGISVVTNLSHSGLRSADVISSLAILLREGLLKMGASSVLRDFMQVPQGCFQASAALELGQRSSSTNWCYQFDEYLLEFLLRKGQEFLSPELLCSHKLLILRQYDQENHTEFYKTLKLFLEQERNVLQTAKALFIHRSTLFYRLERIQKIAEVNLEDAKERMILRISFYLLEEAGHHDTGHSF